MDGQFTPESEVLTMHCTSVSAGGTPRQQDVGGLDVKVNHPAGVQEDEAARHMQRNLQQGGKACGRSMLGCRELQAHLHTACHASAAGGEMLLQSSQDPPCGRACTKILSRR